MRNNDPRWMSIGELWELNKDVMFEYAQKLWSDELELEERLRHLLSTGGELSARMGFQFSLGGGDCGSGISRRRDRCWSFRVGGRGAWAAVGL